MQIALGIDTGGTYTDAVLFDQTANHVLNTFKALTTHYNLAIGIEQAVAGVLGTQKASSEETIQAHDIVMVGLSTTLATNAIVEGQGSPICLILIGYDPDFIRSSDFKHDLVTDDIVYLQGGHNGDGDELTPLDITAAQDAILSHRDSVAAFAVSGYFGVRNPAHELQVKALVEALTVQDNGYPLPVTCGHELTTKLNAIKRATTVALNASLIAVLRELIVTVRGTLDRYHISAPLMVVKGDGSLVRSDWAIKRPIETILSGPAASVVGAWHLAGRGDIWVVDVGGTTTDIAVLRDGQPRLNPRGAQVGRWQTMVEAIDVHTVGLGGDSYVQPHPDSSNSYHRLSIGPRRVLPLCRLGTESPSIIEDLKRQLNIKKRTLLPFVGHFIVKRRNPINTLAESDRKLLDRLQNGPISLIDLANSADYRLFLEERIYRLVRQQLVLLAAFTPTDALHVLGRFQEWDREAARLGAELAASQLDISCSDFCELVTREMSDHVSAELISKVIHDEGHAPHWSHEPAATAFLTRALGINSSSDLGCRFTLQRPIVAVGAPVEAYMPRTSEQLHTTLIIPEQAGVANALGAVAGSVVLRANALVRPVNFGERYRLHISGNLALQLPEHDFEDIEACVQQANDIIPDQLVELAHQAGAEHVEVKVVRSDHTVPVREQTGQMVFLETTVTYTAVGRPATQTFKDNTQNAYDKPSPVIRRLQAADADALAHFYNNLSQASKRTFRPIGPITIPEKCAEIAADNEAAESDSPGKYDLIATSNGSIIGWSFLWELGTGTPTFGLAVADAYHRKGIGNTLITQVMQWAVQCALPEVHLTVVQDNTAARILYQKHGFVKTGEFTGDDGLPYFSMVATLDTTRRF